MKDIKELDHQYITGTYNRFPVTITWGSNDIAYDENGKEYIDLESGYGTNSFGFCDPDWINAVEEQLHKVQHTSNLYYTEPCAKLAQLLAQRTGMANMFFTNSGGEANECALKAARRYQHLHKGPDCYEIISMKNSFHGRSYGALSATGNPHYHEGFEPLVPGFKYAEFNNPESVEALVDSDRTAAIIVECVQGEGGVVALDADYVAKVAEFCKKRDLVLIVDEVQTGVGRTGKFLACEHFDLHPDIVTLAKGLGGGLPIGAVLMTAKVAEHMGPGTHGSTYAGHPVSCAASLAVLRELKAGKWPENAKKVGDYFAAELAKMPHVTAVRHRGLFVGVVLEDGISAAEVKRHCIKNHFLVTAIGSSIIRMVPPLVIREVDCDEAVARLSKSINEVAEGK